MTDFHSLVAYSLRFDASFNVFEDEEYTKYFNYFVKTYFVKYMFAMECKEDGTEHFQGICWASNEIKDGLLNLCRSQIKRKLVSPFHQGNRGSYSFKIARNARSLAKYCNDKEGLGMITNVTLRERDEMGKWEIKKVEEKDNKKNLMLSWLNEMKNLYDEDENYTRGRFFHDAIERYFAIYDTLPRHTQVEKWMYKYVSDEVQKKNMISEKYKNISWLLRNEQHM